MQNIPLTPPPYAWDPHKRRWTDIMQAREDHIVSLIAEIVCVSSLAGVFVYSLLKYFFGQS